MVKRGNFFFRNYSACWEFFKESRWYIVFALGIFALTFLIGFAYPAFFRAEIFGFIEELVAMLGDKGGIELTGFIFLNNLKASFMAIILGIGIGIFPLVTAVVNGYLLGFVSREAVSQNGLFVLWQLLPHGIFELPAVIFSIGIGMRLGSQVVSSWWLVVGSGKGKRKKRDTNHGVGYVFMEGLRFFVFVIFPLLLIAAVVEGLLIGLL